MVNKNDPVFVGVRPHVDVNFSGNYTELDFLLMCGRKERSSEHAINICLLKHVTRCSVCVSLRRTLW